MGATIERIALSLRGLKLAEMYYVFRRSFLSLVFPIATAFPIVFASSPVFAQAKTNEMQATSETREETPVPGEQALLGRLRAPCCWQQTLDIHTGPVTDALRAEIRQRLRKGESAAQIEADLVARHGERMRAVAKGDPVAGVSLGIVGAAAAMMGILLLILRKWRRAEESQIQSAPTQSARDIYDERLDDELRAMEN